MSSRQIFKNATTAQHAVRDLLTLIFGEELLSPSRAIYVVAPWINNIAVLDNRLGRFDALNPEWGKREVRLIDVLTAFAVNGTNVFIHMRPEPINRHFRQALSEATTDFGVSSQFSVSEHLNLHTKGLLTDRVLIEGSMNLTERGIKLNDESVTVYFDATHLANARVHFHSYAATH